MPNYRLFAKKMKEDTCQIILANEDLTTFYLWGSVYENTHLDYKIKSLLEPAHNFQEQTGMNFDLEISFPDLSEIEKTIVMDGQQLGIKLKDFREVPSKNFLGTAFRYSGIKSIDLETLGNFLVQKGVLTAK